MNINDLKPLSTEQYDKCRESALERVKARIGTKPTRKDFERELGALWSVLDVLALIVFLAAFIISSLHITDYVGAAVSEVGGKHTAVNQLGYIFLAESSMILFMVQHGLTASRRKSREWWLRPLSVPLLLAATAGVFIFVANLASGVGVLLSIMPPLFTIGISFNMERLIIQSIQRRNEVSKRYMQAFQDYEAATHDPETHSKFYEYFAQSLWDKLSGLKANRDFVDAPAPLRVAAVQREMQRDQWMFAQPDSSVEITPDENQADEQRLPFEKPEIILYSNGNGHKSVTEIP